MDPTIVTRSDVIFFAVDIDARVESLVMFFTFTKNNGTDRDTLSLGIVNFREVILMTKLLSREVRLGYSPYLRFPCLYVECLCIWLIYDVTINVHRLLFLQF